MRVRGFLRREIYSYVYGERQVGKLVYHVTKFSLNLSFTVYFKYTEISRYTTVLSIRIILSLEILDVNLTFAICRKRGSNFSK